MKEGDSMTELVDLDLEPGNDDTYIMNCQIFSALEEKFYKSMSELNIIIRAIFCQAGKLYSNINFCLGEPANCK